MLLEYFKLVIQSLLSRKVRSYLTMIGILIGITAVVSLLSLGLGLQESITSQFEALGTNRVIVAPGGSFLGPGTADLVSATLEDDDIAVIERVAGVQEVQGVLTATLRAQSKTRSDLVSVFAFETDTKAQAFVESVGLFDIERGRELKSSDRFKVVLGNHIAEADHLDLSIRDKVSIHNQEFEVVGIQKLIGTGVHDIIVRMPQEVLRELIDEPKKYSMVFVITAPAFEPRDIADSISKALRSSRNVEEGKEDFNVQTANQTIEQLGGILLAVNIVIIGIAAISLLVGGIGIMNAMYTAVLERTRDIGVMKSIGARNSSILTIFLIESGILGFIGGLVGLILGLIIAKIGEGFAISAGASFFEMYVSVWLILGVLLFSTGIGVLSGFFPARQAARLKPVDALRSVL